jgi:hypothetical protein
MEIFRTFGNAQEARDYRHEHGTGGWIFVPEDGQRVILFPPCMTASGVFHHAFAKGRSGQLIGAQ